MSTAGSSPRTVSLQPWNLRSMLFITENPKAIGLLFFALFLIGGCGSQSQIPNEVDLSTLEGKTVEFVRVGNSLTRRAGVFGEVMGCPAVFQMDSLQGRVRAVRIPFPEIRQLEVVISDGAGNEDVSSKVVPIDLAKLKETLGDCWNGPLGPTAGR